MARSVPLPRGVNVTVLQPKGQCEYELWMSSHYSFQTSFDLHINMQTKRGTMAGVDLLPSRYLNYKRTKAWPDLHSNAREGRGNHRTNWKKKKKTVHLYEEINVFSARSHDIKHWGKAGFTSRMDKKTPLEGLTSSIKGRLAFKHHFPIMVSSDREHLSCVISIYIDLFLLFLLLPLSVVHRWYRSRSNWFILINDFDASQGLERPFHRAKLGSVTPARLQV